MNGTFSRRVRALLARLATGRVQESQHAPAKAAPSAFPTPALADEAARDAERRAFPTTPSLQMSAGPARGAVERRLLAHLFTHVPDPVATVDADGRIVSLNPAAERFFGHITSRVAGQPVTRLAPISLTPPSSQQPPTPPTSTCAGWRLGESNPLDARRADGRDLPVAVSITPTTADGQPLLILMFQDMTPFAELQSRERETRERLEQALSDVQHTQEVMLRQERLKALGQLASGIAHDFNNALSMIVGFTELLLSDEAIAADPTRRRTQLQSIHAAAQDATAVVARLREFSRPSTATLDLPPVHINDIVAQAISLSQPRWRAQAQASGRTIRVTSELGTVPTIGGRASELREALANLIINAVDAMPEGGTLTLRTRVDEDMVAVEVADTGTGMTTDIRERIFDPFYTTKGDRGTGLGLPMVQGIVQQHRGEIIVASEPGQGTIFTMRFHPLAASLEIAAAPPPPERPRARGLRVLLAEDEPSLRQILTSYLRVDGHAIQAVANGEEALKQYRPGAFDLVITDRAMPEMGGDQLAATLEQQGQSPPVIMLTGLGDLMNEVGERPTGVDLVIGKPVTLAELRAAVVLVMGDRRSGATPA
ncbi:MAG: response regulator [Chloroflexi bacterium]|nr:response regulator [Chloroflexota bacterium]